MTIFRAADILVPIQQNMMKWPVIACDQYTSQPEYWSGIRSAVGDAPSALNLILPESELQPNNDRRIASIHETMHSYLDRGLFEIFHNAFVYVERTLTDGSIRPGIVGVVDLENYDYNPGSNAPVRATEETVTERIPPRKAVRESSALDMSHILMLADDEENRIFCPLATEKARLPQLYSIDLMGNGGHISGWLVAGKDAQMLEERIAAYEASMKTKYSDDHEGQIAYVVGDGNHSLAAAKDCYEQEKVKYADTACCPQRYALVELENVHDPALKFEPIHRLIKTGCPENFLKVLKETCCSEDGYPLTWYLHDSHEVLHLDPHKALMAVTILQPFLDDYLRENGGSIDYIHGDDTLKELARCKDALGLLLPPVEKGCFFQSILDNGVLPRKTFSMGHAQEKRYYLETRSLRF